MAGDRGAAGAVRYTLLGLLTTGPNHGYDLARHFARGTALGEIVRLSPSHLYALLSRMEGEGLVGGEEESGRIQRRVYHLTDLGRTAVEGWLAETVDHPRDMRIEFPLKLYIALQTDPARAADLVERQRAVFRRYIAALEERQGGSHDAFRSLIRRGRMGRAQAALLWLDEAAEVTASYGQGVAGPR